MVAPSGRLAKVPLMRLAEALLIKVSTIHWLNNWVKSWARKPSQMRWARDSAVRGCRVDREVAWLFSLWPEIHSHSVRAGLGASFTHLIHEASLAAGAGGVVIQSVVRRCRNHISIAVDVDVGRGRPPPFEM